MCCMLGFLGDLNDLFEKVLLISAVQSITDVG